MKKINKINILNIFCLIILLYNLSYQVFNINIPFICQTDSMKVDIYKYDILILKKQKYIINDIVVFKYNDEYKIAKIINIKSDQITVKANQNLYYYDNINDDSILGKVDKNIRSIGVLLVILRSKIVTFLIFIIFVIKFVVNEKHIKNSIMRKNKRKNDII